MANLEDGAHFHANHTFNSDDSVEKARAPPAVTLTAELFEKLYLSPQNQVKGELRKTFGNPTPIGLVGFLIALTPLSCNLMGWRGANGNGAASIGAYFFFGGFLQILTGILEWILGNTYPSVVFSTYGAFFLTFGGTLNPGFAAVSTYAPPGEDVSVGLTTRGFNASFGFFLFWMGIISLIYLVCSFRVNICFVIIFLTLQVAYDLLAAAYWFLADDFEGNANRANNLIVGAGACCLVSCAAGWWVLLAIMLAVLDFPIQVPVGDLSTVIRGASDRSAV